MKALSLFLLLACMAGREEKEATAGYCVLTFLVGYLAGWGAGVEDRRWKP